MSNKPHHCEQCNRECEFSSVIPFEKGREDLFSVAWKCPSCGKKSLIVSPIGPLGAPDFKSCLHCGHATAPDDQPCAACGTVLLQILSAKEQARPESEQLQAARKAFAEGACRRGLTITNFVLRRNRKAQEAWTIKREFLEHLGFSTACAKLLRLNRPWWRFWI